VKYYAVKKGKITGIYNTLKEYQRQTEGVSNSNGKAFKDLEQAKKHLGFGKSEYYAIKGKRIFSFAEFTEQIQDFEGAEFGIFKSKKDAENYLSLDITPQVCYAVRRGTETGVFTTWEECKKQINSFTEAEYKKFYTLEEAKEYLESDKRNGNAAYAFVDGSFNDKAKLTGGGGVLFYNNKKFLFAVNSKQKDFIALRNTSGEILGAVAAIKKAKSLGLRSLTIYHDFSGVNSWANENSNPNKEIPKVYKKFVKNCGLRISFIKVAAHTGIAENELADIIAKYSVGLIDGDTFYDKVLG